MQRKTEYKSVGLELKSLEEDGTFEGRLSVYNVVDYGGDLVESGAFTKTLQEQKGRVPMLWQHKLDSPIGVLELSDSNDSLDCKGTLNMDVEQAREAHSMMKFLKQHGLAMGLSIGFLTIRDKVEKGIKRLKELQLLEGSIVTLAMNRYCVVTDVKGLSQQQKDFNQELEAIQTWALTYQLIQALASSLDHALYNDMDREGKLTEMETSISQFHTAFMEFAPRLLDMWGVKQQQPLRAEALDTESRRRIKTISDELLALLGETNGTPQGAALVDPAAAAQASEPETTLHSWLDDFKRDLESAA